MKNEHSEKFRKIYNESKSFVFYKAYIMGLSFEDAEDIMQEGGFIFLETQKYKQLNQPYYVGICIRQCHSLITKREKLPPICYNQEKLDTLANPTKNDDSEKEKILRQLRQILQKFSERDRGILLLSESGWSSQEIADKFNSTAGAMRVRKYKLIKLLKRIFLTKNHN